MSENPYSKPFLCMSCMDIGTVSKTHTFRRHDEAANSELTPCPSCGTQEKHDRLWRERHLTIEPLPEITERDLTTGEAIRVKSWHRSGHHMMDCLRWIEGERFDPVPAESSKEFQKQMILMEKILPMEQRRVTAGWTEKDWKIFEEQTP